MLDDATSLAGCSDCTGGSTSGSVADEVVAIGNGLGGSWELRQADQLYWADMLSHFAVLCC